MEENIVKPETAELAKRKNFNWRTRSFYESGKFQIRDRNSEIETWDHNTSFTDRCSAPTQSHLQTWLREVHGVDITVDKYISGKYVIIVFRDWEEKMKSSHISEDSYCHAEYDSYSKALESGLIIGLNLLKDGR